MNSKNTLGRQVNFQPEVNASGATKIFENLRVQANLRPYAPGAFPSRDIHFSQFQVLSDYAIGIDTTIANVTLTLLPASTTPPTLVRVKWVAGTNTATIAAQSGDTIDGSSTLTLTPLNHAVDLLSVGNNQWRIMSSH